MALGIALVVAVLAASPAAPDTTTGRGGPAAPGSRPGACAPLDSAAHEAPAVAADVAGTLRTHGGVVRWLPERGPVRVWVQPRPATLAGPTLVAAAWRQAVLDAADAWREVVPGLVLTAEGDSARADVRVTWGVVPEPAAAALALGAPGGGATQAHGFGAASTVRPAARTALAATARGHAAAALVVLALEGEAALDTPDAVRAVARHEFGHVLGLAHHAAARSVMAPVVRATRLAPGDRDALRLLYRCRPARAARCPERVGRRVGAAARGNVTGR
jgi:predicted Zn-dependent protease